MWNRYFTPTSLDETLQLLDQHQNHARVIAGGTDILIEIEQGRRPNIDTLIDITRVPNLDNIYFDEEKQVITLGALVTHNHVVDSQLIIERALPLAQASWEVGAPQIRNRATVAGNLITASPANDTITPLLAMNTTVTFASVAGERTIALKDFYTGYRQTAMQANELLTAIHIPAMQDTQAGIFLKLALRRAQAISVIDMSIVLSFATQDRTSEIVSAALSMGAVAPTIIRFPEAEAYLQGKTLTDDVIAEASRIASLTPSPIGDVRGSAEYRVDMIAVYVGRALKAVRDGTEAKHFPKNPAMLWGEHKGIVLESLPQMVQHERDHGDTITTSVNEKSYTATGGTHKTLLRFLRDDLGLIGTKEGCSEGECGACTVILDDVAVMSCMVAAPRAHGATITTVEGLAAENGTLHPIQQSFVEAGAVQCGFCTPGFLMAGAKLLDDMPNPNRAQIEQSISGNLCRCTGYYKILEAFEGAKAAKNAEFLESGEG